MNNPFTLVGKTILVTGASAGIGRGIAVACAGMGAQVILTARNIERLQETLAQLEGEGHTYIAADLINEAERRALVEQLPMLDGVLQCAGVGNRVPCKMLVQEDLDRVMKPNAEAPMLLQSLLLSEKKIKKQSSVVFIASAAATMPVTGNAVKIDGATYLNEQFGDNGITGSVVKGTIIRLTSDFATVDVGLTSILYPVNFAANLTL